MSGRHFSRLCFILRLYRCFVGQKGMQALLFYNSFPLRVSFRKLKIEDCCFFPKRFPSKLEVRIFVCIRNLEGLALKFTPLVRD